MKLSVDVVSKSYSFDSLLFLLIQAKVLSITHLLGCTANPGSRCGNSSGFMHLKPAWRFYHNFNIYPEISNITDKLLPVINEWRSRPLQSVYPIVFMDGMFFKVKEDGHCVSKYMYNILGIDQNDRKEVLGFYLAESEGANFWLGVLNDLKERGVEDILIACVDGV